MTTSVPAGVTMVWQRIPAGQGSSNALTRTNYHKIGNGEKPWIY